MQKHSVLLSITPFFFSLHSDFNVLIFGSIAPLLTLMLKCCGEKCNFRIICYPTFPGSSPNTILCATLFVSTPPYLTSHMPLSLSLSPCALQALAMNEVNGPIVQVAEPQIAMFCGRQLLHMNLQTGQWEPDPQGRQGCFKEPSEILSYCQEVQSWTFQGEITEMLSLSMFKNKTLRKNMKKKILFLNLVSLTSLLKSIYSTIYSEVMVACWNVWLFHMCHHLLPPPLLNSSCKLTHYLLLSSVR